MTYKLEMLFDDVDMMYSYGEYQTFKEAREAYEYWRSIHETAKDVTGRLEVATITNSFTGTKRLDWTRPKSPMTSSTARQTSSRKLSGVLKTAPEMQIEKD